MTVVPIHQLRRNLPEQGRIRIGKRSARGTIRLDTFRFTSHDELAIREIASRYGGDPVPWSDGPRRGEWEVVSQTARIPVLLPPAPLGEGILQTPIYELWSAGGCLRRCDGINAMVPDGETMSETPCICDVKNVMECKPKTRLNVILREIRFGGSWRIESGGKIVSEELPGMVDMLLGLQARGIIAAELTLREERKVKNGRTTKWMVPMLTADESADMLSAGGGTVTALAPVDHPTMLMPPAEVPFLDDDVIDVKAVVDDMLAPIAPVEKIAPSALEVQFYRACEHLAELPECDGRTAGDIRHQLVRRVTRGRTDSSKTMTRDEMKAALDLATDILGGFRRVLGFNDEGLRVSKLKE